MNGFSEGKTRGGISLAAGVLLAGWILVVARALDGIAVLLFLGSWYLVWRGRSQIRMILSGMLLVAGISGGLAIWPWGCLGGGLMVCAGLLLPRPRRRGDLESALLISVVLLALLTVFSGLHGQLSERLVTPVVLMAGWWLVLRLVTIEEGRRLLGRTTIPVWLTVLVWLSVMLTGNSGLVAERRARTLLEDALARESPRAALDILHKAGSVFPWSPLVWAETGAVQLELGEIDEAFGSFMRGYEIRPGRGNPCHWGLAETARMLDRAYILAELIDRGVISPELAGTKGRMDVAVELWRRGDLETALKILGSGENGSERERELAGWIAQAAGHDSTAIRILELIVERGESSGETIYRLAEAYDRRGLVAKHQKILDSWGPRFPNHLILADLCNTSVSEYCSDPIDSDGMLLGNTVNLLGWDTLPKPARTGETLTVRTCWAATKPLRDMVMILHFDVGSPPTWRLNEDHAPLRGRLSTSKWPVGELVVDVAKILIPKYAPVGTYRVFTGLWEPGDEETRLRPEGAQADLIPRGEKRIPLGTIEVVRE